ncbi:MAG: FAD-dependent oxidoreductase [Burkholderiaceae bacterium]
MRVAIVGSGIAGLAAAHRLQPHASVTLFEAGAYFGGHTHTVDVALPVDGHTVRHGVDTGFLVYNERTYPQLIALFAELKVHTSVSDMSFSVQTSDTALGRHLEWSGNSLSSVFSQRRNLISPRFLGMLRDLARFNTLTQRLAREGDERQLQQPLGAFLRTHSFGAAFCDWYFMPMVACIWSCPKDQMLQFPVATMIRFCHNHGLNQVSNRPQWWTVTGGARNYVDKILHRVLDKRLNTPVRAIRRHPSDAGVTLATDFGEEHFDKVVLATHSDQSLALLSDADSQERATLGAIRYHPNHAVLHTDASVLPRHPRAWAAWNYESRGTVGAPSANANANDAVCLHYLLNKLQPLPWTQPVLVSLNPIRNIAPETILGSYDYAHPVFDRAAVAAQGQVSALQGVRNTYFCGAWMGYGFHEDGLKAGLEVARRVLGDAPVATAPAHPQAQSDRQHEEAVV